MLKYLAILPLAFFMLSIQAHAQKQKAQQASDSDQPAAPTAGIVPQQSNSPTLQKEAQKQGPYDVRVVSTPDKDAYDYTVLGLNFALACVGIGGIMVAVLTLRKIERQTKATEITADAADISAKMALRAIQSWITVEVRFVPRKNDYAKQGLPDHSAMIIILNNRGGSPAEILRAETVAVLSEYALPETPVYISEEVAAIPGEIISLGEQRLIDRPVRFCERISEEDISAIRKGEKGLYCWGMIEYTDSSGDLAITLFGHYWYSRKGPQDGRPEAMYRISNPQYNFTRRKAQANEGQNPN